METNDDFKQLGLRQTYSSLERDLVQKVVVPLLKGATHYDRAVGFFTSNWLKEAAKGLVLFVKNQGKARILTSLALSEKDWNVIEQAEKEKQSRLLVRTSLENTCHELETQLEWDTLAALAWLVRDGILEFRFALPQGHLEGGIFHSKLSLFLDGQGNGVALHGSQNDSTQASLNEETLSVFCSWNNGACWYHQHQERFENMWNSRFPNLQILKVPEAEKHIFLQYTERLPRPYALAHAVPSLSNVPVKETPSLPADLYVYQKKAIENWEKQKKRGIFEMATGTGKTITAIGATLRLLEANQRLAVFILVPYQHLVDQWLENLKKCGFQPIPCYESKAKWHDGLKKKIREFNAHLSLHLCLVATHATASDADFINLLSHLHSPWLLIGDEVHGLGAPRFQKGLIENATWPIGLSATPNRWYDEKGTQVLRNYFGESVIDYDVNTAIKEQFLVPYHYFPILIDLSPEEIDDYQHLSAQIAQECARVETNASKEKTRLEHLLRKRAKVLGGACEKLPKLLQLVEKHRQECEEKEEIFRHALFYCHEGTHKTVLAEIAQRGIRVHEFVCEVSLKKRREILEAFAQGEIESLVAIRCLDEGVDVPAIRRAYLLASSTNPRQFVQRRGRILRKSPHKEKALVYDFLVGPWQTQHDLGTDSAKSLLERELPRFAEFVQDSENGYQARATILPVVQSLNLEASLRKKSWELYQQHLRWENDHGKH